MSGLYDEEKFTLINEEKGLAHNEVYELIEDQFGNIWFATVGGASKYGRAIFEISNTETGLPDNYVYSLFSDSQGRIWCGTHKNLGYLSNGVYHPLGEREGIPGRELVLPLSFAEDKDGNIYIGSDRGLWYLQRAQK